MLCPNCGKEIEDEVTFCKYCGAEIKTPEVDRAEAKVHGKVSLVMGIFGLFFPILGIILAIISDTMCVSAIAYVMNTIFGLFFPILGILAIIFGVQARRAIKRSAGKFKGDSKAIVGLVLGIVGVSFSTIMLVGILSAIVIPGLPGIQQKGAKINAAKADVTKLREAIGIFEIDNATYNLNRTSGRYTTLSYSEFVSKIKDPYGNAYMMLPDDGITFTWVSYTATNNNYEIHVKAHDSDSTDVYGTPYSTTNTHPWYR